MSTKLSIGSLVPSGGKLVGGARFAENRLFKALVAASAFVIACVGAVICYNSVA